MFEKQLKIRVPPNILSISLLTFLLILPQIAMAESREGLPGRRVGGGTRGGCELNAKKLTALSPENNLALTKAAYPTLFFFVPQISTPKTIEFVLRDDKNHLVYEKNFTKTGSSGIINLSLPQAKSSPPLTVGKNYRWYLSMICEPKNRAKDIVVSGWIQRVQPNPLLMKKLEQTKTVTERADLYISAGLWQDALATLAEPRYTQPNNSQLTTNWTKLLQTEKLEALAQEPLLNLESNR